MKDCRLQLVILNINLSVSLYSMLAYSPYREPSYRLNNVRWDVRYVGLARIIPSSATAISSCPNRTRNRPFKQNSSYFSIDYYNNSIIDSQCHVVLE